MASGIKYISPLQFITMDGSELTHLQQVIMACEAGIDWIQLRIKEVSDDGYLSTAIAAKKICDEYNCRLIVNDRVHIAQRIGAYGVHVGKEDMQVATVRTIVGNEMVIGGTANTVADILVHHEQGADYIGLGPYRFTTTKKRLSPVLGREGYEDIMQTLKNNNVSLPVVAIGGIQENDIAGLLETGVHGIAFSGLLIKAADKKRMVTSLQEKTMKAASQIDLKPAE